MLRLDRAEEKRLLREAAIQLERVGIKDAMHELAGNLAMGPQRLLEIARALVLLLDEPAAGLSTQQGHEVFAKLADLPGDTAILFIEHDMNLVFQYADIVSVFAAGSMVLQDTPENVRKSPRVREVYLGA